MSQQFDAICVEKGVTRKRCVAVSCSTARRSIPGRPSMHSMSSSERFRRLGIEMIAFYWPPLGNTIPDPAGKEIGPLGRVAKIFRSAPSNNVAIRAGRRGTDRQSVVILFHDPLPPGHGQTFDERDQPNNPIAMRASTSTQAKTSGVLSDAP